MFRKSREQMFSGRMGAPCFSLELGYCDKYVIIDCSSILGFVISSGLISCLTPSQSSARPIASVAFWRASLGSQEDQSGHNPGAQLSKKNAYCIIHLLFIFLISYPLKHRLLYHYSNLKFKFFCHEKRTTCKNTLHL